MWPEDPLTHLKDYFGNMQSPEWEVMEQMQEENDRIRDELPNMEHTIAKLMEDIELEKRKNKIFETYKAVNVDGSVSMKSIVLKLSGFAKFDLDHKISSEHFHGIAMKLSMVKD